MRIIKSAIAVSLCILVNLLRGGNGIVFYSQLAALWCIQMYRNNTFSNALQRTIGTVVGALYGLIYILVYPRNISGPSMELIIGMVSTFISIVLVLYTTVLINKKQAAYFSCVVFLSIVVNHIGDANPYLFVWNRFLDTMIGIVIGVCVNNIRLCIRPDRETLYVSGVDGILVDKDNKISAFSKVELNRMLDDGLKFTISTMRTPASLLEPLSDINYKYPVIVMDGAALYDVKRNEYVKAYVISQETSNELVRLMQENDMHPHINVIIDDTLLIYYQEPMDEVNRSLITKLRMSPYRNYVKRDFPGDEKVVYFMLLDTSDKIDAFYDKLREQDYNKKLKILKYASEDYSGYSYIKIYNQNATKENMLQYLREQYAIKQIYTFGTISGKYDMTIEENNFNKMVRLVRKRYEPFWGIRHNKNK